MCRSHPSWHPFRRALRDASFIARVIRWFPACGQAFTTGFASGLPPGAGERCAGADEPRDANHARFHCTTNDSLMGVRHVSGVALRHGRLGVKDRALKGRAKRRTSLRDCWMRHGRCGAVVSKSSILAPVPARPSGRLFCCTADPVVSGLRTGLHHRLCFRARSGSG